MSDALLAALEARRSYPPRELAEPAPSPEAWQRACEAALRAPDHHALRPFRFVHVGADARAALGALFEQAVRARGGSDEDAAHARERAFNGPGLVAVLARIRDDEPEVPPHEQWLAVGAALMNLLNALHAQGFGAKALGGAAARSELVRRAFCDEGECIACWVVAGTPTVQGAAPRIPPRELLTDWPR